MHYKFLIIYRKSSLLHGNVTLSRKIIFCFILIIAQSFHLKDIIILNNFYKKLILQADPTLNLNNEALIQQRQFIRHSYKFEVLVPTYILQKMFMNYEIFTPSPKIKQDAKQHLSFDRNLNMTSSCIFFIFRELFLTFNSCINIQCSIL